MAKNCYGCKFALEARNHVRHGEQVRCQMAEELFGGERWVDVRRSEKTGKLLKTKCGEFQPFIGDVPENLETTLTDSKPCSYCGGKGETVIQFVGRKETIQCTKCNGKGAVPNKYS